MSSGTMMLLPPAGDRCQTCAVDHEPEAPHNPDSFYWQVAFNLEHGRVPTWADALEHCAEDVREQWVAILATHGVIV